MSQRISLNPANPVQDEDVIICYDFTGLEITSVQLEVEFTPPGGPTKHKVTTDDPCVTVTVPATALSMLVKDLSGNSPDKAAAIRPK